MARRQRWRTAKSRLPIGRSVAEPAFYRHQVQLRGRGAFVRDLPPGYTSRAPVSMAALRGHRRLSSRMVSVATFPSTISREALADGAQAPYRPRPGADDVRHGARRLKAKRVACVRFSR
jgi:hypothetical protein